MITAEIPLPGDPTRWTWHGVAIGGGSVWVGLHSEETRDSIVRIDLDSNEIVAEIPVAEAPPRKRIAVTDDAVWVASHGLLERVDLATNTVVARVEVPGRAISAIAVDATAVWALTIGAVSDDGATGSGTLVRVDTRTNEIAAEIPLGSQLTGYEDEVHVGGGSVWVLGVRWLENDDAELGSDLIRIEPETNTVVARVPVAGFHMVIGPDAVWVRSPADGAFDENGEQWVWTTVDLSTNDPGEPFAFDDDGLRLVSPQALWSVGYDDQLDVRVTRFDPDSLEVEARSEPIRSYYHDAALDPVSGTVWIAAVRSLVRIDIG